MLVTAQNIVEEAKKHRRKIDASLITKAYSYSEEAHRGQMRKSGDPYFMHPAAVANILASHGLDEETIATGLLHDVVEDTLVSLEQIKIDFGAEISQLVDGVTKLSTVSFRSKDIRQSESFRKMLLAMAQDIRVIIVKLADRLHNMRTLDHMPTSKQVDIAQETLDIYSPLAHRLGISSIKNELEDLSFKFLKPSAHQKIIEQLRTTRTTHDQFIARIIDDLAQHMKNLNIKCEVSGRRKHAYSIFKKMEERQVEFDQVNDILAFRILVDTVAQCYEVLGHTHSMWKPVPGRFKDFIAIPKANMYQSLHTTLIGPRGERIEVQIRTHEMHRIAEEGIAAHWSYKDGSKKRKKEVEQFAWLRQMVEWQQDLKDSHEFIETVKIDLFSDEVYVFTPQGDVLDFPRQSTPIDYAYRVHSEVGHHCKGAIVNGRIVPLRYQLQNGDTVEIITDKNASPSKDWLKIAVTSKARSKIRAFVKRKERDSAKIIGRELLSKEFKKHRERLDDWIQTDNYDQILTSMGFSSLDDLLVAIAYGKVYAQNISERALNPEVRLEKQRKISSASKAATSQALKDEDTSPILVGGVGDILIRFGKCCNAVVGDPIVGFVTRGRGVTVHKSDCYMILETDEQRKVSVAWAKQVQSARSVRIRIVSTDRPGILASISQEITRNGGNVENASIKTSESRQTTCVFEISIPNIDHLTTLLAAVEAIEGIIAVERIRTL